MTEQTQTEENSQVENSDETQVVTTEETVETQDESTETTQEVVKEEEVNTESEKDSEESDDDEDDAVGAALKKVRNEARNLRSRLRQAEQELETLRASKNDEAIAAERDDWKQKYEALFNEHRTEKVTRLALEAAQKHGAVEPAAIVKLIDQSKIEWNDDGEPENVADVVADLKTTFKGLFTRVNGNGNAGNRDERGSSLEGMKPQDLMASAFKKRDD